jgi:hypothetical protein
MIAYWLVFFVVKLRHERMLKGSLNSDAFSWMDLKHTVKQVYAFWWSVGELLTEGDRLSVGLLAHETTRLFGSNKVKVLFWELSKLR